MILFVSAVCRLLVADNHSGGENENRQDLPASSSWRVLSTWAELSRSQAL
jgi:hypothetical protein